MSTSTRKQVLILGGGFSGLYTALGLEKTLARDSDVQITLVNRENFSLFTPMLHEVAASDLDMTHIVNPVRKLLRRVQFFHGDVEHIDVTSKHVVVVHGPKRHSHELKYDYLVLALGATTNFFGLSELEHRAMTMKSLSDAIHLRNRLIDLLEEADFECAIGSRPNLLTIIVAGGGFAGVETIAAVKDFMRDSIRFYPHLSADMVRAVLVHPGNVILPELGTKLGTYAHKKLAERKVEIRVNTKVVRVDQDAVELSDGSHILTGTVIWTAGTSPNPLIATLPYKLNRGRIVANEYLEVQDWPGVWALGDCASILDPKTAQPYPPTAQHALRQGKTVAKNVTAAIRGGTKTRFSFSTLGLLAAIGRRSGVANILGINFSGFVAWFLWRTIYLSKLPRLEKKVENGIIFRCVTHSGTVWGSGISEKVVWWVVRQAAQKASIEKLAPHDLRRTCARLCHSAGGELEQIQFLLGHRSVETTERYLGSRQRIVHAVNDKLGIEPDAATG